MDIPDYGLPADTGQDGTQELGFMNMKQVRLERACQFRDCPPLHHARHPVARLRHGMDDNTFPGERLQAFTPGNQMYIVALGGE